MDVIVKFFGIIQEAAREKERKVQILPQTRVQQLYHSIIKTLPERIQKTPLLFAVNQEYVKGSYQLKEGDECAFIPPMSGG